MLGLGAEAGDLVSVERQFSAMGTRLAIRVEAESRDAGLAAVEAAVRAVERAEGRLSTWKADSELSRLNSTPKDEPFRLSPDLSSDLGRAARCFRETGGAFDPAVGALVDAWDLRGAGRRPSASERRAALVPGGFGSLELLDGQATRRRSELRVEEGGFGKGAGIDDALAALAAAGARAAVIDLGGEIAFSGEDRSWTVRVADPTERRREVLEFRVGGGAVATSGNSERGIVIDGVRHGHLLDPRSGDPAPDFGSLTVWAADATTADCLSTGLYVLGPDAALAWVENRDDVEILILEPLADGALRGRATSGLASRARLLDERLHLEFRADTKDRSGGAPTRIHALESSPQCTSTRSLEVTP